MSTYTHDIDSILGGHLGIVSHSSNRLYREYISWHGLFETSNGCGHTEKTSRSDTNHIEEIQ